MIHHVGEVNAAEGAFAEADVFDRFNGNFVSAEMVKAFVRPTEYRGRFGPP